MNKYKYTKNWFLDSELKQKLLNYINKDAKNSVLEIGCYEGLSSVFFADNILNHPESTMICVDPFLNINNNDHEYLLVNNEEDNFDYNISICSNKEKIIINKITSDLFFKTNKRIFNFIYIDGCHECDFITRDMENSFKFLESGGIMWMDDYGGGDGGKIRNTMNKFLSDYVGQYNIIHTGYQLAIIKI
jgi:hypothetical protein